MVRVGSSFFGRRLDGNCEPGSTSYFVSHQLLRIAVPVLLKHPQAYFVLLMFEVLWYLVLIENQAPPNQAKKTSHK